MKGCFVNILFVFFLLFVVLLVALGFLRKMVVFENNPAKLEEVSASICSATIPESFKNIYAFDGKCIKASYYRSIVGRTTNGFILTMDTSLVNHLGQDYLEQVKSIFLKHDPKKVKTKSLPDISFDGTNKITRFYSSIKTTNDQTKAVFESCFSYSNRLVMTAFITANTNYINVGKSFIDSVRPPITKTKK